jgi:protein-arginine kinase activator protein McsA
MKGQPEHLQCQQCGERDATHLLTTTWDSGAVLRKAICEGCAKSPAVPLTEVRRADVLIQPFNELHLEVRGIEDELKQPKLWEEKRPKPEQGNFLQEAS